MISDSTPALDARILAMRQMQTPGQRMTNSLEMSELIRSLEIGLLRSQHPEADEHELRYQLARKRYGPDLATRAFGRQEAAD